MNVRLRPSGRLDRAAERGLEEQARVDEVAVELDRPVEVGAGRVTGLALVADDLALCAPPSRSCARVRVGFMWAYHVVEVRLSGR